MCRLQQLSFESGVIRSEGNTQTSGLLLTENCRHVSTSADQPFFAIDIVRQGDGAFVFTTPQRRALAAAFRGPQVLALVIEGLNSRAQLSAISPACVAST